ncbi:hypothetical protein KSB_50080 [Ktedonobacter robiniae]|uniref:Uncharacterized protein n=1 Tax=Ktedonobacter robiniae TaxID=2778365 RepID=A0ABQ3UUU9_9CHLR|nr:hypothetical protein KSB_50080 [Ktedonobacter robiniae]
MYDGPNTITLYITSVSAVFAIDTTTSAAPTLRALGLVQKTIEKGARLDWLLYDICSTHTLSLVR